MRRYERALPRGQSALRKVTDPARLPDLGAACRDLAGLRKAVGNSLDYLGQPGSRKHFPTGGITHARVAASLRTFAKLLDAGLGPEQLEAEIRRRFDVYESVGCDGAGTVLFTGYATPLLDGSLERTGAYRYPLYRPPPDLAKNAKGETLGRRLASGHIVRYPPRAEIESSGMLAGNELVWLREPYDAYVAHIEGSAHVHCPDGRLYTVGFAASNGHAYRSFAKDLARDAGLPFSQLNRDFLRRYFREHPEQFARYSRLNPRFVFFELREGGPLGSLGQPTVARRTIATDKTIFPRTSLALVSLSLPKGPSGGNHARPYTGFVLDQDTGGALRSPGRCDLYMGAGNEADALAARIRTEGRLFYLLLKGREPR